MDVNSTVLEPEVTIIMNEASSLKDLVPAAKLILSQMKDPIMIIGPMTTGGKENMDDNFCFHDAAVTEAILRGQEVFYQSWFKDPMIRVITDFWERRESEAGRHKTSREIIFQFYLPVFKLGIIKSLWRLPDWNSSVGTILECDVATSLGQPALDDYPVAWLPDVESRYEELKQVSVVRNIK